MEVIVLVLSVFLNAGLKQQHTYDVTIEEKRLEIVIESGDWNTLKKKVKYKPLLKFPNKDSCEAFGKKLKRHIEADQAIGKWEDFSGYGILYPLQPVLRLEFSCVKGPVSQ